MLIFFAVLIVYKGESFSKLFPSLMASLLYVHNIVFGKGSNINTVAWSLEVEVQFYILAPMIFQIFRKSKTFRRFTILSVIIVFAILNSYFDIYYRTLLGQLHFFLCGVFAADIYLTDRSSIYIQKLNNPVIFLISIAAIFFIDFNSNIAALLAFLVALLTLFAVSISEGLKNRFLKNDLICFTGGMCYSIYLIHYPLISVIGNFILSKLNTTNILLIFFIECLIIVPILFFASVCFYLLFERPFMDKKWPQKLFKINPSI